MTKQLIIKKNKNKVFRVKSKIINKCKNMAPEPAFFGLVSVPVIIARECA